MEDIKRKALQAHSEGRLVEAEHSYRILLEKSDDPDVAINLEHCYAAKGGFKNVAHTITVAWSDGPINAT